MNPKPLFFPRNCPFCALYSKTDEFQQNLLMILSGSFQKVHCIPSSVSTERTSNSTVCLTFMYNDHSGSYASNGISIHTGDEGSCYNDLCDHKIVLTDFLIFL